MAILFPSCAGLMGAAGVAVSAAAAHIGGGTAAATAGNFLLFHAAALLGLWRRAESGGVGSSGTAVAGLLLIIGCVLFSGDLTLAGLADLRPWPTAAPLGGVILIAGWLTLPLAAAWTTLRHRRSE